MTDVVDLNQEAGDSPVSPIAEALPLACNAPDDVLFGNIRKTVARGTPLITAVPPHDMIAALVGGGPSVEDDVETIRQHMCEAHHIFALNGAGLWLQQNGIVPHAVVILDARAHNARFVRGLDPGIRLYLASQCDESLFAEAKGRDVITWHPHMGGTSGVVENRDTILIGGSTTVGMRAMRLVHVLGYRTVHLYGYDSSYRDGDAHAYDQHENAADRVLACGVGDQHFVSAPWMIRQADDFRMMAPGLLAEGLSIHVHGDGLLPAVAQAMNL